MSRNEEQAGWIVMFFGGSWKKISRTFIKMFVIYIKREGV